MSETGASSAFEDAFHKAAERHERAWVFLAVTMLTLLLAGTMFLVVYAYGIVVRTDGFRRDPAALDAPEGSIVKTGPNAYTVTVVAHLWRWSPSPLRIPKGATVTFRVTSADVLHGFAIQGTTVNVTAVPASPAASPTPSTGRHLQHRLQRVLRAGASGHARAHRRHGRSGMTATAIPGTLPASVAAPADVLAPQRRTMLAFLVWGFSALMIGAMIGPLQALNYGGINAYPALTPILKSYYQGLTIHGVLNAYIFTFFVTCGLLVYLPARELGLAPSMALWRGCFATMALGTLMLLLAMFDNSSSVLWTFYPPLKGSAWFYLGMTLVVLGSLMPLPILLDLRARWKRAGPARSRRSSPT